MNIRKLSHQPKKSPTDKALATKEPTKAVIRASSGGVVRGEEGTILGFPANAFVFADGRPVGNAKVDLTLHEFLSLPDLLVAGLATESDGRMLETAGTFHIEANADGEPLQMAPGRSFSVQMNAEQGMTLFRGVEEDGAINWKLAVAGANTPDKRDRFISNNLRLSNSRRASEHLQKLARLYGGQPQAQLSRYLSGDVGWINCDKFSDVEMVSYEVEVNRDELPSLGEENLVANEEELARLAFTRILENEAVMAILHERKALLRGQRQKEGGDYVIRLPKGERATIVVVNEQLGDTFAGATPSETAVNNGGKEDPPVVSLKLAASTAEQIREFASVQ